jgi:hypothetical protein
MHTRIALSRVPSQMAILHGWPVAVEHQSDGVPPLLPALFLATVQGMYSLTAIGQPAVSKPAMIEFSACV